MDLPDQEAAVQRTTCYTVHCDSRYRAPPGARLRTRRPRLHSTYGGYTRNSPLAIAFPVYCDYTVFSSVDCNKQGILLLRPAAPATPGHRRGINRHYSSVLHRDCNATMVDQILCP